MAAVAAAMARIPHGRLVSLAVPCAFLLGMLWLVGAQLIARAVKHCLTVEGSVLDDDECSISLQWPLTAGFMALVASIALPRGDAVVSGQVAGGAQDGGRDPEPALAPTPQSCDKAPPHPVVVQAVIFLFMYVPCGVVFVVGKWFQRMGAWRLLEFGSADKVGAYLVKVGPIYCHAGFLALSVVHCFVIIPYVLQRLVRFLREKCVGSLSDLCADHQR